MAVNEGTRRIVGGVDTHKDLHVAAVVDEQDRVIGTRSFATTRQGYRQMLTWMRSFGPLRRAQVVAVAHAGDGVDLPVVGNAAERVRQRPGRERVRGEPRVHQRQRGLDQRRAQEGRRVFVGRRRVHQHGALLAATDAEIAAERGIARQWLDGNAGPAARRKEGFEAFGKPHGLV